MLGTNAVEDGAIEISGRDLDVWIEIFGVLGRGCGTVQTHVHVDAMATTFGARFVARPRERKAHETRRKHGKTHASLGFDLPPNQGTARTERDGKKPTLAQVRYGLDEHALHVLGLADGKEGNVVEPTSMSAKSFYVGDLPVDEYSRSRTTMMSDVPGQAPPDLPSMLLNSRICFLGMALVPSVTELIVAQLLWLSADSAEKPVYFYINSTGTQSPEGESVGFETEAYAIIDTMRYINPDVHTIAVGKAHGNAAMLLASGKPGCRYALPHANIVTCPPRLNRAMGSSSDVMIKANELEANTTTYVDFMAKFTGRDVEEVRKDIGRKRYFTPRQAVEYGLIDQVIDSSAGMKMDKKDYDRMLAQAQAMQERAARGGGAPAGAM